MKSNSCKLGLLFCFTLLMTENLYASSLCHYKITIKNAEFKSYNGPENDVMSSRVAQVLKAENQSGDCVDLRSSSSSRQMKKDYLKINEEDVSILYNGQLPENVTEKIKEVVCELAGNQCGASVSFTCEKNEDLVFQHDVLSSKQLNKEIRDLTETLEAGNLSDLRKAELNKQLDEKWLEKNKRVQVPVGQVKKWPTFSNACTTGKHEDSWNNTASTEESRKLLKIAGVNISDVRSLDLRFKNSNKQFWSFGFPDHSLDQEVVEKALPKNKKTPGSVR